MGCIREEKQDEVSDGMTLPVLALFSGNEKCQKTIPWELPRKHVSCLTSAKGSLEWMKWKYKTFGSHSQLSRVGKESNYEASPLFEKQVFI